MAPAGPDAKTKSQAGLPWKVTEASARGTTGPGCAEITDWTQPARDPGRGAGEAMAFSGAGAAARGLEAENPAPPGEAAPASGLAARRERKLSVAGAASAAVWVRTPWTTAGREAA